jgi:acetoin utilization deacetylase AcuC-like enzyme
VAVAIRALQRERRVGRVAIVDLDVHQGNGTARIFAGDESVFTFSMHGEKNYPFRKEVSRLDVALPDGCADTAYLGPERPPARPSRRRPVCYLAGADPYRPDRSARSPPIEGCGIRTGWFAACRAAGCQSS